MCRIAAYIGPPIALNHFLLAPDHSLMEQSWAPREMKEATLNADGFGVGWFAEDGVPALYTNPMPIWTDPNLDALGRVLNTDLWLAYVRSATRRTDVSHANTQPFTDGSLMFTHNGYIDQFGETLRHHIRHALTAECEKSIHGNTDSEYLFALLRQHLMQNNNLEIAIREMFKQLEKWAEDVKLLLNIVVAGKDSLLATRHAINGDPPSLYYSASDPFFPDASLIASEPLTERANWVQVPEHHVLKLSRNSEPEMKAI